MKAVQTRCPQGALQVLSEGSSASTVRGEPRCEAQRKRRQHRRLGGGEWTELVQELFRWAWKFQGRE